MCEIKAGIQRQLGLGDYLIQLPGDCSGFSSEPLSPRQMRNVDPPDPATRLTGLLKRIGQKKCFFQSG